MRRYERKAAQRYWHMVARGRSCNQGWRVTCLRCLWFSIIGRHKRDRAAEIAKFQRFHDCPHENRRPNPEATAVLDRNPEVCLDCGIGILHARPDR